MREGPEIALIGSLLGDPARSNMLMALMSGKALTAGELAREAGVTPQTASSHLAKLEDGGMVKHVKQGRHRYYALQDQHVADLLESMTGLAAARGHMRLRTGPKDPAMRHARLCYSHLAGEKGVQMLDSLAAKGLIQTDEEAVALSDAGRAYLAEFGVILSRKRQAGPHMCKTCLDWSARRYHLGGVLGRALWARLEELEWAKRDGKTRIVLFSRAGEEAFQQLFPMPQL
ncbi:MAG: transcriptional regulator [Hyphomicrobiales bacterium]|nr:MAG: transcriptional regulator [Hyphomicrobiales bacterium]